MADEVDVENFLVGFIAGVLYPNGTLQPCAAGVACTIFRGWPTQASLGKARSENRVLVSVATRNGVERNTSRYPMTWQQLSPPVHTLTASVRDNVITLGGTVDAVNPQNVVVLIGQTEVYSYRPQGGDTPSAIASALATLIAQDYPGASSNGPSVTINGTGKEVVCRIAGVGIIAREVKRQEKSFQISIWSPPWPDTSKDADYGRTAVAKVLDPALAALIRVVLPDNSYGHIHYERTITLDKAQAEGLYRRDLFYWVEYPTLQTQAAYEIGAARTQTKSSATPTGTLPLPESAPVTVINK